jgi:hypothetical protein
VALVDSQYNIVIRGVAIKNMFSRVGLATAVQWPNLRNVLTDKVKPVSSQYMHIAEAGD